MKAWINILSFFIGFVTYNVCGQQPVYIEAHEIGRGILKARSGECFVIAPAHVVQKENRPFLIRGARNVLSKGEFLEPYPPDLAIVRIIEGGNQNCENWNVDPDYDKVLASSVDGFLEISQTNGAIQSMKVFLLEKDNIQITIRPHYPNDQIVKGMSGSSLFTKVNDKKTYLGMLVAIDNATTGIVLQANVIDKALSNFFTVPRLSDMKLSEVAVIAIKGGTMDAFELAQKASDILTKQYPSYSFIPYEKDKSPINKTICEISELTEGDPDNRVDGQIYKYKSQIVLTIRKNGQLVSRETLDGGGTDYSKENAKVISIVRTLELSESLKFEKR